MKMVQGRPDRATGGIQERRQHPNDHQVALKKAAKVTLGGSWERLGSRLVPDTEILQKNAKRKIARGGL